MIRRICFAMAAILGASAATAQVDLAKMEVARLQGAWRVVALEAGGRKAPEQSVKDMRFLIEGDKISSSGKKNDLRDYRLDVKEKLRAMDIFGDGNKEFSKAIYEVDGDMLKLCFSQSTQLERPKTFDTTGTKYLFFTLKRDKQ